MYEFLVGGMDGLEERKGNLTRTGKSLKMCASNNSSLYRDLKFMWLCSVCVCVGKLQCYAEVRKKDVRSLGILFREGFPVKL